MFHWQITLAQVEAVRNVIAAKMDETISEVRNLQCIIFGFSDLFHLQVELNLHW